MSEPVDLDEAEYQLRRIDGYDDAKEVLAETLAELRELRAKQRLLTLHGNEKVSFEMLLADAMLLDKSGHDGIAAHIVWAMRKLEHLRAWKERLGPVSDWVPSLYNRRFAYPQEMLNQVRQEVDALLERAKEMP